MSEEDIRPEDGFLFILSPEDMIEFFEGWPEGISLVIWRDLEQDKYYLLPEENLIDDIGRIGGKKDLPVFPAIGNMRSVRISFAEESDIVSAVSRRSDLLDSAKDMRARLDGADANEPSAPDKEESADSNTDLDDFSLEDEGSQEERSHRQGPTEKGGSGLPDWLVSSLNPTVRLELDISNGGRALSIRVPAYLVRGDMDYAIALDQTVGRILLAPITDFPDNLDSIPLTRRDTLGMIEYRADLPSARALRLPQHHGGVLFVPLIACGDGMVLADLSHVTRDLEYRKLRKESLVSLGAALVLSLFLVGYIGSSVVTGSGNLGNKFSDRPSFQSPEYMEQMLGRWFSN